MNEDTLYIFLENMAPDDQTVMHMLGQKLTEQYKADMQEGETFVPMFIAMGKTGQDPNSVYAWFETSVRRIPMHFKFRAETSGQAFVDAVAKSNSTVVPLRKQETSAEDIVIEPGELINE